MQIVKRAVGYLVVLGLLGGMLLSYTQRQAIADWWRLRDYEPSPAIAALSVDAAFTDLGEKLFYVHDPDLLTKEAFQGKCQSGEETIVLGCYISNQKIYIFDVEDDRLEGVEEVTAAHEMLHAAYDRLSDSERERIDQLTADTFANLDNPRLTETIDAYRARDPSVVPNELHSILPTEIRELPRELEEYYKQYFTDRLVVVGIAEAYEAEFTQREDQIKAYDQQLAALRTQIDTLEGEIDSLNNELTSERQELEALRSDPEVYNAAVPAYNAKVQTYNGRIQTLRSTITSYNEVVEARNAIAVEERDLVEAIDTRASEL